MKNIFKSIIVLILISLSDFALAGDVPQKFERAAAETGISDLNFVKVKVASIERGEKNIFIYFSEPVQIGSNPPLLFFEHSSSKYLKGSLFDIPVDAKEINIYYGYNNLFSTKMSTVIGLEKIL